MNASFVTTSNGGVLRSVRSALTSAQRVLMCVAFVREAGLHLLERELAELRKRERPVGLLVTTTFGSTTPEALALARELDIDVRIYNPGQATFHPKVYLGIDGDGSARAFIGSANLTSGLAANVEAGLYVEGSLQTPVLRDAWQWAESLYDAPVVEYWSRSAPPLSLPRGETLDPFLLSALEAERQREPIFKTLGRDPRPNHVVSVQPDGVFVETERSRAQGRGAQLIPAWMFNLAWDYLKGHRELTNRYLLDELRVHRSSAVCALLARVPGVTVFPASGITLRLAPPAPPFAH